MHGVGPQRCQVKLTDLRSHIPRNQFDRGLHLRNHSLGFVDPIQAGLTETFVLRHAADRVHLCVDICRNALTVATHAALSIDYVVDLADGTDALRDLLSLRAEALVLEARRLHFLCELLQACGSFWRATWATLLRCVAHTLQLPLSLLKPLLRLGGRLCSRPLLGGHGAGDCFDPFMLHMEEVWRVVRPKVRGNIRQQARRFIACRLDHLTVQTCKRLFHEGLPRVLIAAWGCLLQEDVVARGLYCHQAKPPSKRFLLGQRDGFGGHVFGSTRAFLVPIRHAGLLHWPVDLGLRPIGSRDKALKACALQK